MEYIKFSTNKISSAAKRELKKAPARSKVILKEYPQYLQRKECIKPAIEIQPKIEQPEIEYVPWKSDGGIRVLYGIMAALLLFAGVYLSGLKAHGYIEEMFLGLIESKRESAEEAISDENVKTIGEKYFVESEIGSVILENEIGEKHPENQSFAKSVQEAAQETESNKGENEAIGVMSETENNDAIQVIAKDMSKGSDKIYCTNRTDLEFEINDYAEKPYPIKKINIKNEEPKVLIIHTHGTEAYRDTGENGITRSENTDKNVVRVGEELAQVLRSYGIPVIHSKTMHDKISYVKAYDSSKTEAMQYLENYPTIEYVIDVHRDALGTEENPVKTYTTQNGESSAQLMFVMGTNASGGNHPNYEKNLTMAVHLQKTANQLFPGLMRPINVRPIIFNQNLRDGCMILEVGSDANTLAEAITAVRMFGRIFSECAL